VNCTSVCLQGDEVQDTQGYLQPQLLELSLYSLMLFAGVATFDFVAAVTVGLRVVLLQGLVGGVGGQWWLFMLNSM